MKNKVVKILFFSGIIMLLTGCGKEETVFDTMSFSQNPINVSNPITDPEVTNETINLVNEDRNLYYERYEPETSYIPSQVANSSYSKDDQENEIPNGLINFNFERQKLRTIDTLVDKYSVAEEGEYKWNYNYKNEEKGIPKDYFTLTETRSIVGKPKDEESLNFDDFKFSTYYNYNNANTIENLSIEINNGGTTKEVSDFLDKLTSVSLTEDFRSIIKYSPNTSDSDTVQIYSGDILTEDKNSSYSFYREYNTPLKEAFESVSAKYDIKFLDSYTQKTAKGKTIINKQDKKFSSTVKMDYGFMKDNELSNFKSNKNLLDGYTKILPKSDISFGESKKEYDNYNYFKYTQNENLNPADKFTPIEKHSYSTKFTYTGNLKTKEETKVFDLGVATIDYEYTKTDEKFSSFMYHLNDTLSLPLEGIRKYQEEETFNIDATIDKKIKKLLSGIDIGEETFYTDYNRSLFTDLNELDSKITLKITTKTQNNNYIIEIDLLIESSDIYGISEINIVSENSEIEYDLQGNIINKGNKNDDENKENDDTLTISEIDEVLDLETDENNLDEDEINDNENTDNEGENSEEADNNGLNDENNDQDSNENKNNNHNSSTGGNISDFF